MTVGITKPDHSLVIGSGFRVTQDGGIITCRHVLEAVGVSPSELGAEIEVLMPTSKARPREFKTAVLEAVLTDSGDDVVLLRLIGAETAPPEEIAVLGYAELAAYQNFRSFGFRELGPVFAAPAYGQIQEFVDFDESRQWRSAPFSIVSSQISGGMSGAPVLAVDSNLIVGVIFATWETGGKEIRDRDTGWAVDAAVLENDPFNLKLREQPLPPYPGPRLRTNTAQARASALAQDFMTFGLPETPRNWVGRRELMSELGSAWGDADRRVIGLIGFGGEGKSTIARRYVDEVSLNPHIRPGGVFWWTFSSDNVEEFFEKAITFVGGDSTEYRSASSRAHRIVAAFQAKTYLFILDGLEQVQYEGGERYGRCKNQDLVLFLELTAGINHQTKCVVTSRAPLVDLVSFTTYVRIDVVRLAGFDARLLLRGLGVRGSGSQLDTLVEKFSGHALALTLVGSYLREVYNGKIERLDEVARGDPEGRSYGVSTVLGWYDQYLAQTERALLSVLSGSRRPLPVEELPRLVHVHLAQLRYARDLAVLDDAQLRDLAIGLANYRLAAIDQAGLISLHPLTREYFYSQLSADEASRVTLHLGLRNFYAAIALLVTEFPSLEELAPYIEAVHHSSRAGDYEAGYRIYIESIDQGRGVLVYQLGAYDTDLALALEFFPDGDVSREPLLSDPAAREYLVRSVALAYMTLGRLFEAYPMTQRSERLAAQAEDWLSASKASQLLAELHIHLGQLLQAVTASQSAYDYAGRVNSEEERKWEQACSLAYEAWAWHLIGEDARAGPKFDAAELLQQSRDTAPAHLEDLWGIYYADYLLQIGDRAKCKEVLDFIVEAARVDGLPEVLSECERALGDVLLAASSDPAATEEAAEHYDQAVQIVSKITHRAILIEALLARGRFAGTIGDLTAAQNDLDQALSFAHDSGYRIYEAEARLALARAYAAAGSSMAARSEAALAEGLGSVTSYHRVTAAAREILTKVRG